MHLGLESINGTSRDHAMENEHPPVTLHDQLAPTYLNLCVDRWIVMFIVDVVADAYKLLAFVAAGYEGNRYPDQVR